MIILNVANMMNKVKSLDKRMTMVALTWPIFIETSIRMFFLSIDTLMLSAYSDKAVAAVGLISQFMFFVIIVYQMVGAGTGIVLTQYLGGNKTKEAKDTIAGSIIQAMIETGGSICVFSESTIIKLDRKEHSTACAAHEDVQDTDRRERSHDLS